MKSYWHNNADSIRLTIDVYEDHWARIGIYRGESWSAEFKKEIFSPVEINWPSIGAQPIEKARLFALALQEACDRAGEISGEVFTYRVKGRYNENSRYVHEEIIGNNEQQVRDSIPETWIDVTIKKART